MPVAKQFLKIVLLMLITYISLEVTKPIPPPPEIYIIK